jgi:predicted ester cyclase
MADPDRKLLWHRWIDLWNGDLDVAQRIIHPDFSVHRTPPPRIPGELHGREALLAWIRQTRTSFSGLHLTVEVGPLIDGDLVAGRWLADGVYQGGIMGSTAPVGTLVRFRGTDLWRADGELIREYWLSDDLLDLLQQVGVVPAR